jgi:hypothetical protein
MSADRTKSRKAKRAAAFKQEPEPAPASAPAKLGRPAIGQRRLRDKPLAREAVIFQLMITWLKWTPRQAATFAAAVGSHSVIITQKKTDDDSFAMSYTYTVGDRSKVQDFKKKALNNRRDKILQFAPAMIAAAKGDDEIWLQLALQAVQGYLTAMFSRDPVAIMAAQNALRSPKVGWTSGPMTKLILKDQ